MGIEQGMFQTLEASRYVCFYYPNPCNENVDVRVAILDSDSPHTHTHEYNSVETAAILVPKGREDDWIFSTQSGHHQLLSSAQASRLILIARTPSPSVSVIGMERKKQEEEEEEELKKGTVPLLLALSTRAAFKNGLPVVPFLSYTDNVVEHKVVEIFSSPLIGMMIVEDVEVEVEVEVEGTVREWRRRLRFQRMPNLVQTEVALIHGSGDVDLGRLVHPYLPPIVAGLVLVGLCCKMRVVCIGVGGGALLMFLNTHFRLSMDIVGVEIDEVVLKAAKKHFGLVENENEGLRMCLGDGLQVVQNIARQVIANHYHVVLPEVAQAWHHLLPNPKEDEDDGNLNDPPQTWHPLLSNLKPNPEEKEDVDDDCSNDLPQACHHLFPNPGEEEEEDEYSNDPRVHAIIIDVDAGDAVGGGLSAPPLEFIEKRFLLAAQIALHPHGILAMNVIDQHQCFYNHLLTVFREVFSDIYQIRVNNSNAHNYVLFASPSHLDGRDRDSTFANKIKQVIRAEYVEGIKRV